MIIVTDISNLEDRVEHFEDALQRIVQRLNGPYNSQLWDIRQIAETALTPANSDKQERI